MACRKIEFGAPAGAVAESVILPDTPLTGLVSVVVACYGQLAYTKGLVNSLARSAGCEYELILVDNGCPEGTAEWAEPQGIRTVRMGRNAGVPAAYNAGVAAAKGEFIALFNNDMLVHPNGLKRLAQASQLRGMAAQTGGAWGVNGKYLGSSGDRAFSDYAEGYCLTFPRAVWDAVGPWNEAFWPSYSDDAEWGLRARLKGYDFTLVPGCVEHFGQATSGTMDLRQEVLAHQRLVEERFLPLGLGQRTLVKRWGANGDLIMTTPVLRALKREAPLGRIHVHCHGGAGAVLDGLPYVDRRTDQEGGLNLFGRVIDLNHAYERGQLTGKFEHPVSAYCRVAGVEYDGQPYDFHLPEALKVWAERSIPATERLVACGIRSGMRPKQNWRSSGWLELADALPDGVLLVALDSAPQPSLTGRGDDLKFFYRHPKVLDLTGQTPTLQHTAAVMTRCQAFVGVDSGLLHVAHALGLPTVDLCAAAPRAARASLIGDPVGFEGRAACFPCQYETPCPEHQHCLDWVQGSAVASVVKALLSDGLPVLERVA